MLLLAALGALAVATLRVGPSPVLELRADDAAIGGRTGLSAVASGGGRGLAGLRIEVEQGGVAHVVARKDHRPPAPWAFSGERTESDELRAEVGHEAVPALVEGEAVVRVES